MWLCANHPTLIGSIFFIIYKTSLNDFSKSHLRAKRSNVPEVEYNDEENLELIENIFNSLTEKLEKINGFVTSELEKLPTNKASTQLVDNLILESEKKPIKYVARTATQLSTLKIQPYNKSNVKHVVDLMSRTFPESQVKNDADVLYPANFIAFISYWIAHSYDRFLSALYGFVSNSGLKEKANAFKTAATIGNVTGNNLTAIKDEFKIAAHKFGNKDNNADAAAKFLAFATQLVKALGSTPLRPLAQKFQSKADAFKTAAGEFAREANTFQSLAQLVGGNQAAQLGAIAERKGLPRKLQGKAKQFAETAEQFHAKASAINGHTANDVQKFKEAAAAFSDAGKKFKIVGEVLLELVKTANCKKLAGKATNFQNAAGQGTKGVRDGFQYKTNQITTVDAGNASAEAKAAIQVFNDAIGTFKISASAFNEFAQALQSGTCPNLMQTVIAKAELFKDTCDLFAADASTFYKRAQLITGGSLGSGTQHTDFSGAADKFGKVDLNSCRQITRSLHRRNTLDLRSYWNSAVLARFGDTAGLKAKATAFHAEASKPDGKDNAKIVQTFKTASQALKDYADYLVTFSGVLYRISQGPDYCGLGNNASKIHTAATNFKEASGPKDNSESGSDSNATGLYKVSHELSTGRTWRGSIQPNFTPAKAKFGSVQAAGSSTDTAAYKFGAITSITNLDELQQNAINFQDAVALFAEGANLFNTEAQKIDDGTHASDNATQLDGIKEHFKTAVTSFADGTKQLYEALKDIPLLS